MSKIDKMLRSQHSGYHREVVTRRKHKGIFWGDGNVCLTGC